LQHKSTLQHLQGQYVKFASTAHGSSEETTVIDLKQLYRIIVHGQLQFLAILP